MFKISTKSKYGLSALMLLAEKYDKELVQIKDLVEIKKVPKNYIEQIFNRLTKFGIVKSVRGNKGGYSLATEPSRLKLFNVIETLEGELNLNDKEFEPVFANILESLEDKIKESLDISFAELLVNQEKYKKKMMFHI